MLLPLEFCAWLILSAESIRLAYKIGTSANSSKRLNLHFIFLVGITAFAYIINYILPVLFN